MGAIAQLESDPVPSFVGKVLHRSSPVLTWRPTAVLRIKVKPTVDAETTPESTVQRISRVPTRRVLTLPVLPSVERRSRPAAWSVAAHVAIALVLASGVALGIVALDGDATGIVRPAAAAVRVASPHVLAGATDALATAPAPLDLAPASVVARPAPPHRADAHRGHAHHGGGHGRVARH